METEHAATVAAQLRRLEASTSAATVPFDYAGLLERQAARNARAQRRHRVARATAGALVVALVGASVWRLGLPEAPPAAAAIVSDAPRISAEPRIVRADTYFALAALEDHIARVDDALNVARLSAPQGGDVARLERTRNELLDSYAQVRYAELVSANF
jgi:hypothetical protein